jgi:hypothetical protein
MDALKFGIGVQTEPKMLMIWCRKLMLCRRGKGITARISIALRRTAKGLLAVPEFEKQKLKYMEPEKIVQQFNNVEWDGNGDPLYSYEQMLSAVKQALQQTNVSGSLPIPTDEEIAEARNERGFQTFHFDIGAFWMRDKVCGNNR